MPVDRVDLAAAGLLAPLPAAFLDGRDRDLLAPLRFLDPGDLPPPVAPLDPAARAAVAAELATANQAYGHPHAGRLAERLADPETQVVVTGQQPGLFGGPLYALSKMVAAGRWAAALEAAGRPAVALFWMATEDHDWDEVASAVFGSSDGPVRLGLGDDPDPLLPVGMRSLGAAVGDLLDRLEELRGADRYGEWVAELRRIHRPVARFGEAFARLAVAILGERTPLLVDSMGPALKAAERPWLERLVERRRELEAAYAAADAEIERRGYPLQVHPQRDASPLFVLHDGHRRRVVWTDDFAAFGLRGGGDETAPVERLESILAGNPAVVSPGVLARNAVQDAVFGTCLEVLGPGETSYLPQAAPAFRVLEVPPPSVALRPQVLVLESHHRAKLDELGLPLATLLGDEDALERALAADAETGFVARSRAAVEEALEALRAPALELDPNLERPFEKTRANAMKGLDVFADKVRAAAARRDEVRARRVDRLRQIALPCGKLQERVLSTAHYPGKYGTRFVDALWDQMELDGRHLQVVEP